MNITSQQAEQLSPQPLAPSPQPPRGGLTLIELLVVIIILTTIVAAAIPIMAPSNDDRRLREASRGLNTYITGAQARAISLNRPYGIALKRLSADTGRADDNTVCLEVFYAEQQPPYAGFDRNSRACVALHPDSNLRKLGLALVRFVTKGPTGTWLPVGLMPDLFPQATLRPGDVIEVSGTRYVMINPQLVQVGNTQPVNVFVNDENQQLPTGFFVPPGAPRVAPTMLVRPINDTGQMLLPEHEARGQSLREADNPRPPYWTGPAPYRVLRQPTLASDEPYQLPEGTAIDLRASGIGSERFFNNSDVAAVGDRVDNSDSVMIMFAPEGGVYRVSYNQKHRDDVDDELFDEPIADNVYLLVGKRENIPAPLLDDDSTLKTSVLAAATTDEQRAELREPINWLSGNSRWVVIGSQSGRIVTVENGFVELSSIMPFGADMEVDRNRQIIDAREFTREMAQLGGR